MRISILAGRGPPRPDTSKTDRPPISTKPLADGAAHTFSTQIPVVRDDVPNKFISTVPLREECARSNSPKAACERVCSTVTRPSCSLLQLCVVLIALPHTKMPHLLAKRPRSGTNTGPRVMNLCFCASPRLPYNVLAVSPSRYLLCSPRGRPPS